MANDLTGNPLIIDTAFSAAEITQFNGPFHFLKGDWHEPTASDNLTIQDNSSTNIWDDNAVAGGTGINLPVGMAPGVYNGFNVTVIDGGTLYIYYR